ncbi:MAG: hypothetical protein AAF919_08820 [Pseudomonadota bacterium]
MRLSFLLPILSCLYVVACGDLDSTLLLDARASLVPEDSYTELDLPGDPPGDRAVVVDFSGLGDPTPITATGDSLRVNSRINIAVRLVFDPVERVLRPDRYVYTIEGTYNEVGVASGSRPAQVRIAVQEAGNSRPFFELRLASMDGRPGGPVRVIGPGETEIGQLTVQAPHAILLSVNFDTRTVTVTGGGVAGSGTITGTTFPLSETGPGPGNPNLAISASTGSGQIVEYEIRRVQVTGSRPVSP